MKKKKNTPYKELYLVKFRYFKPDGFMTTITKKVLVETSFENEKRNHELAEQFIRNKYKDSLESIISVIYA